jgi:hypothetical protein
MTFKMSIALKLIAFNSPSPTSQGFHKKEKCRNEEADGKRPATKQPSREPKDCFTRHKTPGSQ